MLKPTRRVLEVVFAIIASGCGGAAPVVASSSNAGPSDDPESVCPAASFDELAVRLRDYYCENASGSIATSDLDSCDDIQATLQTLPGARDGLDARILQLATPTAQVFVLMACTRDHTEAFFLADLTNWTDEEATTRSTGTVSRLERVDVVPGGARELRLDVAFSRSYVWWHDCVGNSQHYERTILCSAGAEGPRCTDLPTLSHEHAECDLACLAEEVGGSCEDHDGAPDERELRLGLDLMDGRVRVTPMPATVSNAVALEAPAGLIGEHTLDELLAAHPLQALDLTSDATMED